MIWTPEAIVGLLVDADAPRAALVPLTARSLYLTEGDDTWEGSTLVPTMGRRAGLFALSPIVVDGAFENPWGNPRRAAIDAVTWWRDIGTDVNRDLPQDGWGWTQARAAATSAVTSGIRTMIAPSATEPQGAGLRRRAIKGALSDMFQALQATTNRFRSGI